MKESKLATILALAALDDSEIKSLEQRVNELAEVGFKPEIVDELPEEGNDHTLYLVPQEEPGEDPWYKEYLWLDNEWENIGTTSIDFEDYYTKEEVDNIIDLEHLELKTLSVGGSFSSAALNLTTAKRGIYIPDKKTEHIDLIISPNDHRCSLDGMLYAIFVVKEYVERPTENTDFAYVLYIDNGAPTTTQLYDLRLRKFYKSANQTGMLNTNVIDSQSFLTKYAQTITGVKTFTNLPISTGVPTQNGQLTNKKYVDDTISNIDLSSKQDIMQYSTMPTANAGTIGKIIQYTGTTTQDYVNGYFYIGITDGEQEPTYSWKNASLNDSYTFTLIEDQYGLYISEEVCDIIKSLIDTNPMIKLFAHYEGDGEYDDYTVPVLIGEMETSYYTLPSLQWFSDNCLYHIVLDSGTGHVYKVKVYDQDDVDSLLNMVRSMIAPEYKSSLTYTKGSIVWHFPGGLYICTTDITVPEEFNHRHWTQCHSFWEQEQQRHIIADDFNAGKAYNVGDYVWRGGYLYKCITATSINQAWDETKWTRTNVMSEVMNSEVMNNYLAKDNTVAFTPTGNYNPSTKKYVDDAVLNRFKVVSFVLYNDNINSLIYDHTMTNSEITQVNNIETTWPDQTVKFCIFMPIHNAITEDYKIIIFDAYEIGDNDDGTLYAGCFISPVMNLGKGTGYIIIDPHNGVQKIKFRFIANDTSNIDSINNVLVNKKYVDDKIAQINALKYTIVEQLPTSDIDPNTIYLILNTTPSTQNVYNEWMYINNEWELIGSTEVDLTNYLAKDNTISYTPSGQYNPATKGYVDNYFFNGGTSSWETLTPQQQAQFAVALVVDYDLTEEDEDNLSSILGSDEPIVSDITEEEGIEITNEIIGGNE